MIIELYGLTGSGKTFIAGKLEKRGLKTIKFNSKLEKYSNSIFFTIKNPAIGLNTSVIFDKIDQNFFIRLGLIFL